MSNQQPRPVYTCKTLFFLTLDPVHVGSGGYRLGRVDNTIVREPGTMLPKVPGTSLLGAARSYAALYYGRPETAGQHNALRKKAKEDKTVRESMNNCPILYTFGTAADDAEEGGGSRAGSVSLSDARIVFFPVHSMSGPVWITTVELLREAGCDFDKELAVDGQQVATTLPKGEARINVGWLLLDVARSDVKISHSSLERSDGKELFEEVRKRLVIVSPKYFSQVVNNNLEVRTSVSINVETGAAEDGALFTYEAIPRGTWLSGTAVQDLYDPGTPFQRVEKRYNSEDRLASPWTKPLDVLTTGLELVEQLGVGGMGTRGFGRMRLLATYEEKGKP